MNNIATYIIVLSVLFVILYSILFQILYPIANKQPQCILSGDVVICVEASNIKTQN